MGKVCRITGGLIVGALVGAGLVLLFAPRSGAASRQLMQSGIQAVLAEGRQAAETRRLELASRFEALKRPEA